MSRKCRECKRDGLKVIGMGSYEDSIIVECPHCGEEYELEPDGLGEGAMEMVEAYEAEMKRREESDEEQR